MSDQIINFCHRLSESWIAWMGISILETTLVLAVLSAIWFFLRKRSSPQLGYLLFLLIPLRLLIPLEVHIPGVSWIGKEAGTTATASVSQTYFFTGSATVPQPEQFPIAALPESHSSATPDRNLNQQPSQSASHLTLSSWLLFAWGTGVLVLAGRFGLAQFRLSAMLRNADEIDLGEYSLDFSDLCRRIGVGKLRVLETDTIASPSVTGMFRPTILLPKGVLAPLSIEQREWIVLHELAHIRRRDLTVNFLQRIATIVYFPNPAIWLANRAINRFREYACDDVATSLSGASQIESSEAFLSVMKFAAARQQPALLTSAVALGMSRSSSQAACYARMNRLLNGDLSGSLRFGAKSLAVLLLAACIALPHLRATEPASSETATANATTDATQPPVREDDVAPDTESKQKTPLQPAPYHFSVVVAEHVLLLDGKTITTWEGLEKYIEAVPEPLEPYPHFYITRGGMSSGNWDPFPEFLQRLQKKREIQGLSQGSLWPRTDFRYDSIKTAEDLIPDPSLQKTGTILAGGKPVTGAEVVLITPVDESIPYKTYHIALVEGRVRNSLDHVLTHSDKNGKFSLYPPQDTPYYILAIHPQAGFTLVTDNQLRGDSNIILRAWGGIVTTLKDPKNEQQADLTTSIEAYEGRPEITINQYWSDLKRPEKTRTFNFKHVPTIYSTSISRSFPSPDGGSTALPAASVSLLPGETRRIDFGEITKEQLDWLKSIRGALTPPKEVEPPEE